MSSMDHSGHHMHDMGGMNDTMNMSSTTTISTTTMNHHMHMTSGSMPGGHMHGMGDNSSSDPSCQGGMMMYFHTGKCEYVLFEALRTSETKEMIGACFAIFFLAILYEGLKVLREYLLQRSMMANRYAVRGSSSSQDEIVVTGDQGVGYGSPANGKARKEEATEGTGGSNIGLHMFSCSHALQTILHMLQVFISYCLMLVFMTYNAWLCIAVIVGAGVGYFCFGWRKSIVVDINEHCH